MPRSDATFRPLSGKELDRLKRSLASQNPLLKQVGALLVADSQESFERQSLGTFKWVKRYPNQSEPFVNVAGALSDLNQGKKINSRRFDRAKALLDTGLLFRSIKDRIVASNTVEVGTTVKYASTHQFGGESVQPITQTAKKKLAEEIKKGGARKEAFKKLGFFFRRTELKTKVNRRPFIGITDEVQEKIRQTIKDFFEKRRI